MGSGFSKMKKQARLMQQQANQMKETLAHTFFEGSAGNGLVIATLNGAKELKKITIKPECVHDIEGLQDLILGAFEDAASKIDQQDPTMPFLA